MPPPLPVAQQGIQRIFISYRRGDTQWVAGRLADSLTAYFGEVIRHTLGSADAVVVLIGPDWLNSSNDDGWRRLDDGWRRLDDAGDWVARSVGSTRSRRAGVPGAGRGHADAARHVARARRYYFQGAAWTGALGAFTAFMLFKPVCEEYEATVIFHIGMLVATLMLVLMSLSGFREK